MVYGVGINDMEYGWVSACEWNKRVYQLWRSMLQRCYCKQHLERFPTYKNCYVCNKWLKLSGFVEDVKLIDNYDYWINGFDKKRNPYELDKDIKSNNMNKCYCLKECMFASQLENTQQAIGARLIARFTKNGDLVDVKYQHQYVTIGFHSGAISTCCKWYACGEDINEWYKIRKDNPRKSHKGFIFKYVTEEQINK